MCEFIILTIPSQYFSVPDLYPLSFPLFFFFSFFWRLNFSCACITNLILLVGCKKNVKIINFISLKKKKKRNVHVERGEKMVWFFFFLLVIYFYVVQMFEMFFPFIAKTLLVDFIRFTNLKKK